MNDAETTPTDAPREAIEHIVATAARDLAGLLDRLRDDASSLRDSRSLLERQAIAIGDVAAFRVGARSLLEFARLLERHLQPDPITAEFPAAPHRRERRRWSWTIAAKVMGAIAALLAALAAWKGTHP